MTTEERPTPMKSILVAGGVAYNSMVYLERFPEPRSQTVFSQGYYETVGATGAGKALNLAGLGHPVTLHAMIGDDPPGRRIRERLDSAGVRSMLDVDPRGTERHLNLMDADGGRISIYLTEVTFDPELDLACLEAAIAAHDVLALNINNYCRRLIPLARRLGRPIWCDVHDYDGRADYHRDFVEAADFLFLGSGQLEGSPGGGPTEHYRAFMEAQIAAGKSLVVCTHGRRGATALTAGGQWLEQPIAAGFDRVDPNGAGDAFFAGFLSALLDGQPLRRCLQTASVVAGLCVTSRELASPELSRARVRAELERLGW